MYSHLATRRAPSYRRITRRDTSERAQYEKFADPPSSQSTFNAGYAWFSLRQKDDTSRRKLRKFDTRSSSPFCPWYGIAATSNQQPNGGETSFARSFRLRGMHKTRTHCAGKKRRRKDEAKHVQNSQDSKWDGIVGYIACMEMCLRM